MSYASTGKLNIDVRVGASVPEVQDGVGRGRRPCQGMAGASAVSASRAPTRLRPAEHRRQRARARAPRRSPALGPSRVRA